MQICATCGQQNESGATFCSNRECGAVLEWHGEKVDQPTLEQRSPLATEGAEPNPNNATQGTQLPIPERNPRGAVQIALNPTVLEVEPGGTASCQLHVRNQGAIVDQFRFEVTGTAARWASCDPPSLILQPGDNGTAVVQFAPPRAPDPKSGTVPFQVHVSSTQDPSVSEVGGGMVTVAAFNDLSGELTPTAQEGRRAASYQLTTHNRGNSTESLAFTVSGPGERFSFTVEPPSITCEPGSSHTATVDVRANDRLWTGKPARESFTVSATRDGDPTPALAHEASFQQKPTLTPAVFIGAVLLVLLGGLAPLAWLFLRDGDVDVPTVLGMTPDGAATLLAAEGLTLGEQTTESTDQPEGTVIAQSPEAGTVVASDTPVDVTVAEPIPLEAVPDLAGLTGDDAVAMLQGQGLVLGAVDDEESSDQPEGTVLHQEPGAGAEVPDGTSVNITLAVPPAIEQCTDEIMSNERWACLTAASFDGEELLIEFDVDWAASVPDRSNGFHLHLYGGDGINPPDEVMGTHAPQPRGPWVIEDRDSPLSYPVGDSRDGLIELIRDQPMLCVRIADANHALVPDNSGGEDTYQTGNCVPIDRGE